MINDNPVLHEARAPWRSGIAIQNGLRYTSYGLLSASRACNKNISQSDICKSSIDCPMLWAESHWSPSPTWNTCICRVEKPCVPLRCPECRRAYEVHWSCPWSLLPRRKAGKAQKAWSHKAYARRGLGIDFGDLDFQCGCLPLLG